MKIGKATVIVDIIPKGNPEIRPAVKITPKFLTYHNTGNSGKGANAKAHNKLIHNMANKNPRDTSHVSWHLTIDENFIIQHIPFDEMAYHCGDGSSKASGNMTSIGLEICMHSDQKNYHQAEENAIALGVYLAKQLNIPIANHVPHQKWSGKFCPAVILQRDGGFTKFHNRIKSAWNGGLSVSTAQPAPSVQSSDSSIYGVVTVLVDSLNVRAEADFNSKIVKVIHKNESYKCYGIKNGLYHLGGNQYCSSNPKYVKFVKSAVAPVQNTGSKRLQVLASELWTYSKPDWNAKHKTVKKGEVFTIAKELTVSGSKMYQLKSGLYITANTKYIKLI